ncbi:Dbl homology (DH) domain protein [Kalmanozyma brasiliensis GHG001]|uniref:Dbl homology (DH) domain protein n=1 Tax=Kalmanozyma brasiliensis (strain GHG001) TaxID=1365824 RepID=UPI0028680423|nr:Dbl homology (DH) domain protein [Kalmanozyma brasiliensis GHG001]EST05826.2 Dbl homology (DH) domain protein [Kalmanozyma brasiliensis GHG001]
MKRFFSRFSAAGPTSPGDSSQVAPFAQSEKQNLTEPKSPSSNLASKGTIGRTKALVARFEGQPPAKLTTALTSTVSSQQSASVSPALSSISRAHAPCDNTSKVSLTSIVSSVPKRVPGSSLPEERKIITQPESLSSGIKTQAQASADQDVGPRQTSSGSQVASSEAQPGRAVAFAPSPQKQRSTSPAQIIHLQRLASSQPISRTNSTDSDAPAAGSSFARPTAASQARAKASSRPATSDVSQHGLPSSLREKGLVNFNRSASPSHASSSRPWARRSYSHSSGPDARKANASSVAPGVANRISDVASSSRRVSTEVTAGKITAAGAGPGAANVSSPLSFPSRTSLPMRKSCSASTASRSVGRRGSVDVASPTGSNEPVAFPPTSGDAPRSFHFPTWSEMTHEDLVRNLGPRERTRQEVLWEIVASEERYVNELEKVKEIYIDALLRPDQFDLERVLPPPVTTFVPSPLEGVGSSDWSLVSPSSSSQSAVGNGDPPLCKIDASSSSNGDLPIAARFLSDGATGSVPGRGIHSPVDGVPSNSTNNPYLPALGGSSSSGNIATRPGQPNSRIDIAFGLGLGLGTKATKDRSAAAYIHSPATSKDTSKVSKAQKLRGLSLKAAGDSHPLRLSVPLPPSLREVLVAISEGLVEAHGMLSDALKARYEEQWPLVRSLADVFMKHSHILQNYASYVCHLQRAMEELEEAALMERAFRGKRLKKERLSNTVGLGRTVAALEACAAEQGYAGLMIFVSMPFQRLLKYPLLFQNLLFHTDPSTHEFESTVSMVVEVERLVRSIEDEKVNAEERDNTRDAFARIDGITDRQVLRPRPDRVLIEEKALYDERARRTLSESAPADDAAASDSELVVSGTESTDQRGKRWRSSKQLDLRATLRDKRSYRRLSDFLSSDDAASSATKAPAIGSKKDLWLVRFSDVELKCQRIGVTALPMVSSAVLRDGDQAVEREANDLAARSKEGRERLKALRSTTLRAKTRNLYKFISVVAWRNAAARSVVEDPQGIDGLPTSHEVDEEDDDDDAASMSSAGDSSASGIGSSGSSDGVGGQAGSDKYIRSTKLSFTYWGDRVEPGRAVAGQQPNTKSISQVRITRKRDTHSSTSSTGGAAASTDTAISGTVHTAQRPRKSVPSSRARQHGGGGMSGRLSEPLAATSISTAPEPIQSAVAQMHARQRNDKFGARLRTSMANDGISTAALVGRRSSQVSVDHAGDGAVKNSGGSSVRKSNMPIGVGRAL